MTIVEQKIHGYYKSKGTFAIRYVSVCVLFHTIIFQEYPIFSTFKVANSKLLYENQHSTSCITEMLQYAAQILLARSIILIYEVSGSLKFAPLLITS